MNVIHFLKTSYNSVSMKVLILLSYPVTELKIKSGSLVVSGSVVRKNWIYIKWLRTGSADDEMQYKNYRKCYKKYCMKLKKIIIVFSLILKLILLNRYGVTLIVLYLMS